MWPFSSDEIEDKATKAIAMRNNVTLLELQGNALLDKLLADRPTKVKEIDLD